MNASVYCIARTADQAEAIVERLRGVGFTNNDISALLPDKHGTADFAHKHSTKAPEGATTGGIAGMGVGATLGWLAGIGTLAIPGVGPFIAAGPIMAALSGAAVVGVAGGILGGLIGIGIPEWEAKRYEKKIRSGNILISVHSENSRQRDLAKEIFEELGAEDISSATEAAV